MPMLANDPDRGQRLRLGFALTGRTKMMAVAAEIGVSPAAVSKWQRGERMSLEHAGRIATLLDLSLDWLVLGRGAPQDHRQESLSPDEVELIARLRQASPQMRNLVMSAVTRNGSANDIGEAARTTDADAPPRVVANLA